MNRRLQLHFIRILLFATMTTLSGCGQNGDEGVKTAGSEEQSVDVNLQRQDSTEQYKFDIQLPEIIRTNAALRGCGIP